jgi:hypothetical protein
MRQTIQPSNQTVEIMVPSKEFWREIRQAPREARVVLDDNRPGVKKQTELGEIILTLYPAVWAKQKKILKEKRGYELIQPVSRTRLCDLCATPMKVIRELEQLWVMKCPACRSTEMWGKQLVGGTWGAGEKEKLPSGKRMI